MNRARTVLICRQRRVAFDRPWLENKIAQAMLFCRSPEGSEVLSRFEEISFVVVSDRAIAGLHRQFMGIPGPTDVITFEHGEIAMSADTAARAATQFGHTLEGELLLYAVHGMLHLAGYDDHTAEDRVKMHRRQNWILGKLSVLLYEDPESAVP